MTPSKRPRRDAEAVDIDDAIGNSLQELKSISFKLVQRRLTEALTQALAVKDKEIAVKDKQLKTGKYQELE